MRVDVGLRLLTLLAACETMLSFNLRLALLVFILGRLFFNNFILNLDSGLGTILGDYLRRLLCGSIYGTICSSTFSSASIRLALV